MTISVFTGIALLFILFAVSRTILRFKDGSITTGEMVFWVLFWATGAIALLLPGKTDQIAHLFGATSGVNIIIYVSIILIYYLVFRIYIKINALSHELTRLIRSLAINEETKKASK